MPDALLDKILEWIFGGFVVVVLLVYLTGLVVGLVRDMLDD